MSIRPDSREENVWAGKHREGKVLRPLLLQLTMMMMLMGERTRWLYHHQLACHEERY